MSQPAPRLSPWAQLLALPEHLVGEIIGGELVVSPRPASRHALCSSVLTGELVPPFGRGRGGPGGWWILDEPELHLGADVLVPDLAGWRRERLPAVPDEPNFTLAPDGVCEVLSPSTGRLDRRDKLPRYAAAGVAHAWLIDPATRTLEVLALGAGRWTLLAVHGGDDRVRADPFAAIELELAALWGEAPP